jgi:hypothetical protein
MIRSLIVFTLAGVVLLAATPVWAADEPPTAPVSATSAAPVTTRSGNQPTDAPINVSATSSKSSISGKAQLATVPQQVGPGATVTGTGAVTSTAVVTGSSALTVTGPATPTSSVAAPGALVTDVVTTTVDSTGALTGTEAITPSNTLTEAVTSAPDTTLDSQYAGVLEGTIIANRTDANVRYFVEGQVYDLAPLRASGLPLPRPTAVLNLFNCDARQSESATGCFWDPYLLKQDGFYEVVNGADSGALVSLILREAGAPPANQIWIQNRTGEREAIMINNQVTEIAPASVEQFTMDGTDQVVVHLRNCITQGVQTACEWAPQSVDRGYYYALVKLTTAGANNMTVSTTKLEGIVASSGEVVAQPPQASCLLRVPTLNVRSGPGLEFPVVTKVRGTDEQPGSVVVVGYDASQQWMQVSDRIAPGGWVTSNPDFIICTGDLAALPVQGAAPAAQATGTTTDTAVAAPDTAAATAEPVVEAPTAEPALAAEAAPADQATVETAPAEATTEATAEAPAEGEAAATEEPTPAPAIPDGQARLTVYNQFDRVIRFTMDQKYRPQLDSPTGEWDLEPGQSISMLIYPGMVPYSVSSPWNELGGNANLNINPNEDRALYLTFIPDPDGSGDWVLQSW